MSQRTCKRCQKLKPLDAFNKDSDRGQRNCRECCSAQDRARYKRNKMNGQPGTRKVHKIADHKEAGKLLAWPLH
jgi:hypothetical protein